MDTNDSLADISELNGERESETNSEGESSWHDDSDVSDQQSDDDRTEEASTSFFISLPRAPPFSLFTKNLRARLHADVSEDRLPLEQRLPLV